MHYYALLTVVRVAAVEITSTPPMELLTLTLYWYPFSVAVSPVSASVWLVAPETSLKLVPLFVLSCH